jgi:hypothetical protein
VKVLPEILMREASVPVTEYLRYLQNVFEYVKPPMGITVSALEGFSLRTVVFQASSFGFVMVFASLSHPWILIDVAKFCLLVLPFIPSP